MSFACAASGLWRKSKAIAAIALTHFDTGQHATFEIERAAKVREIFIPTGVEVTALPTIDLGLSGALFGGQLSHLLSLAGSAGAAEIRVVWPSISKITGSCCSFAFKRAVL